jgi:hypothetical protein
MLIFSIGSQLSVSERDAHDDKLSGVMSGHELFSCQPKRPQ